MYITLEKQYQFFKFLQEDCYKEDVIKPEYGKLFELAGYIVPEKINQAAVVGLINSQIKQYTENSKIVSSTNNKLEKITGSDDALAKAHRKKRGIKEPVKVDIFAYNKTNIGEITLSLANAIGFCYSKSLGGLEKIMDLKDCNVQIAKQIEVKYKVANHGNKS